MKTNLNRKPSAAMSPMMGSLGLLLLSVWSAVGQDLPYSSGSTGADGALAFRQIPTGRNSAGLAYDGVRQQAVLFGGYVGSSLADTWVWSSNHWTRVLPASSPTDRWSHGMVFDAARGETVMFGGTRNTGRLNDTWTWNGTNWTQKSPATTPGPRDGHCMAYDAARQRVVLFSGNGAGADTWLWDGSDWTQASPATSPGQTGSSAMVYDAARQEVVMFGNYGQTWVWNGTNWFQRSPLHTPAAKSYNAMAYDPVRQVVVMYGGSGTAETWTWNGADWTFQSVGATPGGLSYHRMLWDGVGQRVVLVGGDIYSGDPYSADTWFWNGTAWTFFSGKSQTFDMTGRASGLWNFTTINIPSGVTVRFKKNAENTPVRWLASGNVQIDGAIDVGGQSGSIALAPGVAAAGGPGGYDGGRGGIAFNSSASYVGVPGLGPGGGAPGTAQQTSPQNLRDGLPGTYNGTYGNVYLQPLLGGSGGGGGASSADYNGGNGGGGGGAILIASSGDIQLNGTIRANGGDRDWSGGSYGGYGSGGAILLRADRVTGGGTLQALGPNTSYPNGRIRVEAYARTLTGSRVPAEVVGMPAATGELNQVGTLVIQSVRGVNVAQPPSGNLLTPDVVFSDAGPITVVVSGTGIPNGTPVQLRITTANSVITPAAQNLANGTATFNVTVPAGVGTLQASATFTQP